MGIKEKLDEVCLGYTYCVNFATLEQCYGNNYKQHFALDCAERGLVCMYYKPSMQYLVYKRDQWEDLAR